VFTFKNNLPLFFVFILVIFGSETVASDYYGEPYFELVGNSRNIGDSSTALVQDSRGFIWLGTRTGLFKYDGYHFKQYLNNANDPSSIGGDFIKSLWAAPDGKIWVGTISDGVSVYDPNTDSFINYKHDENDDTSLINNRVEALLGDPNGKGIWFATNNGLDYLEYSSQKITHYQHDPNDPESIADNHIRSLLFDHNQKLWVGHWKGISQFDSNNQQFLSMYSDPKDDGSLATDNVFKLIQSSNGTIWVGTTLRGIAWITSDGIFNRAIDTLDLKNLAKSWIFSIAQVPNGDIWVGTYGDGVYIIDEKTAEIQKHIIPDITMIGSIHNNDVSGIFVDDSGAIWLTFWGGLLNKYNPANDAFSFVRYSHLTKGKLTNASKSALYIFKNGDVWASSLGHGIDVLNEKQQVYMGFYAEKNNPRTENFASVVTITQAEDNSIWLGTQSKGLQEYLPEEEVLLSYLDPDNIFNEYIHRLLPDGQYIWIAASDGISRLNLQNKKITRFSSQEDIKSPMTMNFGHIVKQADGTIWAGSYNGLFMLPVKGTHFIPMRADKNTLNSLSHNHVTGLLVDSQDNLWVSTIHGLNKLIIKSESLATFENINEKILGLPENAQELIEDDQGRLWNSVMMLDPKNWLYYELGAPESIKIGTQSTGRLKKLPNGEILISGTLGIMKIKPNLFQPRTYQAPLELGDLKIDGKATQLDLNAPLILTADMQGFSLGFSALDFMSSDFITYAYKLEGYNDNWIETDSEHRMVSYNNLEPGMYTLKIKATNRQGQWNPEQKELIIYKISAWYQTWIFRLICLALMGVILSAIYKLRLNSLRIQKEELTTKIAERTSNIVLLSEIGKKLTSSLELDSIADLLYSSLNKVIPADAFLLCILEKEKHQIVITKAFEYDKPLQQRTVPLTDVQSPAIYCVTQAKEIIMQTNQEIEAFFQGCKPKVIDGEAMNSVIYLPLVVGKEVIGCFSIQKSLPNAFNEEQIEMIRTLASYTAIALTNALGYEKLEIAHKNLNNALKRLEDISFTDQLTGAHNRHFLDEFMAKEIPYLKRENYHHGIRSQMVFLMIDADYFKTVNDEYGHVAGDLVLKQLVQIIKQTCRESDLIIRWGGEEFLVVLKAKYKDQIKLAEKIRSNISQYSFDIGGDKSINITCSIGMANFPFMERNINFLSWEQTLNIADLALYSAKANGRNAWVSIFEKNITGKDFYTEINNDLQSLIDSEVIDYKSNITTDKSSFFTK
jgi:diguanylate cyclase (GGDEF)-like protein